jgi:folate-binding protein YgfZ
MPRTLLFNRSDRTRFEFAGPQVTATLNGLVTNDVAKLAPGQGQYAGILTPKSKILADVRIFMHADSIMMDTGSAPAPGVREFLRKYINPRFTKYSDITNLTCDIGIFGDQAHDIVVKAANVDSDALLALPPYGHIRGTFQGAHITIIRTPELDCEGYDVIAPKEHEQTLIDIMQSTGAMQADANTWKTIRIAIGWPEWGVDMDDTTLPQEANFDDLNALSHNKGCYIGHETIARIHFRGHVNKTLRRLTFHGTALPPRNAELKDETGKNVGVVTSSTIFDSQAFALRNSTSQGEQLLIGIGMVRREIEDGATLSVTWDDTTTSATILGKAKGAVD